MQTIAVCRLTRKADLAIISITASGGGGGGGGKGA
jgi:hypothetical protein